MNGNIGVMKAYIADISDAVCNLFIFLQSNIIFIFVYSQIVDSLFLSLQLDGALAP